MSSSANSSPETADERARALLAAASRASYRPVAGEMVSISALMKPDVVRLNEVEKLSIRQMLPGLVQQLEREMRARMLSAPDLPDIPEFTASIGAPHVAIAWPALSAAGLPDHPDLAALLVRRARAYTIIRRLRRFGQVADASEIEQLTEHPDQLLAANAMKLLIAESRANDRFDDPRLSKNDLPHGLLAGVAWTIAAALTTYGHRFEGLDQSRLETVVSDVVASLVGEHDAGSALEPAAMLLASDLRNHELATDAVLVDAVNGARFHLYVALLATGAKLDFSTAWDMITMPDAPTHMVLLKSLGVDRDTVSQLTAAVLRAVYADEAGADNQAATWIEIYDALDPADVEAAMRPWRLDPSYRYALARLADAHQESWT